MNIYATRVGRLTGSGDASTQHEETPEADKQWFIDYVADRRRRGIPAQGVPMPGEVPERVKGDPGPTYCRNGHQRTGTNTRQRIIRGSLVTECLDCRAVAQRRRVLERGKAPRTKATDTHCRNGHEFTPANTLYRKDGSRRCRTCAADSTQRWRERRKGNPVPRLRKTHCNHNHEYTPENTYWTPDGHRRCRTCAKKHNVTYARRAAV